MFLEIRDLKFSYTPETPILKSINLSLKQGDIGALLGASGSGKTSLLRCLAGFEKVQGGIAKLDGTILFSDNYHRPPQQRKTGYLFQNLALFPHMTVKENICYGLSQGPEEVQMERLAQMLELVSLKNYDNRFPAQLSGGEKQRVALARALAPKPSLILMDEPFSSLDTSLRKSLRNEVKSILKSTNTSAIIVTHDPEEAFDLCDFAGILKDGRLAFWEQKEKAFSMELRQVPKLTHL